jgi:hypothetical protein
MATTFDPSLQPDSFDPTDPDLLTPEQRLAEIAAILAAGVLRLRHRSAIPTPQSSPLPPTNPPTVSTPELTC